jgi:hypothetical protein
MTRAVLLGTVALTIGLSLACGNSPSPPQDASAARQGGQDRPFEYAPQGFPSESSPPPLQAAHTLPEGTPITIHLLTSISSAATRAGESFDGILEDPILLNGRIAIPQGTPVLGRVLAAKPSGGSKNPGYLRIALVSLSLGGTPKPVETSSLFVKGTWAHHRTSIPIEHDKNPIVSENGEVSFDTARRLTFRLAQPVEFHSGT